MVAQRNGGYHGTFQGELFPRVGFIVTNLSLSSRAVVRFYNKRGTAEQLIKEGKQAVKMTRLSCRRFRSNEVRLALSLLAFNLDNLWRRLVLPKKIDHWSYTQPDGTHVVSARLRDGRVIRCVGMPGGERDPYLELRAWLRQA